MHIQYVFLRSDIPQYTKGSMAAQACHASLKACHLYYNKKEVQKYLNDDNMTTVLLKIKYDDIEYLKTIFDGFDYVVWVEYPENIITALALRPYKKDEISDIIKKIKKFKLY